MTGVEKNPEKERGKKRVFFLSQMFGVANIWRAGEKSKNLPGRPSPRNTRAENVQREKIFRLPEGNT